MIVLISKSDESEKETKTDRDGKDNVARLKIIRGYNGLIPTRFRELSMAQAEAFSKKDLDKMLNEAKEALLLKLQQVTD